MTDRPIRRVLLLVADQWRGEALSRLGHGLARTPNLDALAAEGVTFRRHFTQASPCGPARASLLTGLYLMNHRSGRNGTPLDARHGNLAKAVRGLGFEPFLFGYSDTSADPRGRPAADPALRTYEGVLPGFTVGLQIDERHRPWRAALQRRGYGFARHPTAPFETEAQPPFAHSLAPAAWRAEDSLSAFMADQVIGFLETDDGAPWLTYATFLHPHPPLVAPAPYNALIDPAECPPPLRAAGPAAEGRLHPWLAWLLSEPRQLEYHRGLALDTAALSEADVRRIRATYYGLIAETDAQVGRVLDALKARGLWDDTLVIFTVDHGEMLGDRWLFGKDVFFDGAFHIPLIVRDPRASADPGRGRVVEAFTEAVDVLPTVLDCLDGAIPRACDGASLAPWLRGETPVAWRRFATWEYDFRDPVARRPETALGLEPDACCLQVLRGERWKYVHFAGLPPLLFDLAEDPNETRDLAGDRAYQDRLLDCAQALLSHRMVHAERTLSDVFLQPAGPVGLD